MRYIAYMLFSFLFAMHIALGDTPPPGTVKIKDTDGNAIVTSGGSLNVNITGSSGSPQSVSVSNFPSTQPVSATSLPLPTGAATAAAQATAASSLSSIDGKTPTVGQKTSSGSVPVTIASDQSPLAITGSITATNPSVGTSGAAVPASSTQAAGKDGSGNLRPLSVSSAGVLSVDGSAVTQPVSGAVSVSNFPSSQAVTGTFWQSTQPVSGAVSVSNFPSSQAVTGTFFQATQPVSASALPLPSGAATAANQSTANTSLSSIDSKLTSPLTVSGTVAAKLSDSSGNGITSTSGALNVAITSGGGTDPSAGTPGAALPASATYIGVDDGSGNLIGLKAVSGALKVDGSAVTQPISAASLPLPTGAASSANQATANTSLAAIQASVAGTLVVDGSGVTQPVSAAALPLPSGASTSANQSTANTSLAAIQSSVAGTLAVASVAPANGQAANSASVGTGSAVVFTPPSNCVGFVLEAESSNTANIRWALGSTASSTVGIIAEPGRDSGYIPGCAALSAIALSGTQAVDIIWVQK